MLIPRVHGILVPILSDNLPLNRVEIAIVPVIGNIKNAVIAGDIPRID